MKRGEVWRVLVLGRSERTVLIVGHDRITDARPDVLCVHIDTTATFGPDLVTVPVPGVGAARAYTVGPLAKTAFAQRVGAADTATMELVEVSLRAVLDL